ncbi:MAG: insulinase family protein [Eubacteriales bacterium]|nr:insulinase family protein [Eubacteriales bacterium]
MFRSLSEYDVIKTEQIEDIKSTGTLLRHKKSGARVLLLENKDENKVFNIAFRTPPSDSTGVAHILEHSVLCGSKKFPSKDPFVELAKGSLNTFLNAMTYPDKTMYPVASCNFQDFCNLMHVYMDAVFFPNIYNKEEIFRQEGWSYILENEEDELTFNGVVYNEMKGAFSSADDVLEREIMNSLFPDNAYGVESGGDPKVIPELKYSEFLAFHSRYYHPSNSYIYLYGDMDMEERLAWLDKEYLCKYDAIEIDSQLKLQKPFEKMAEIWKTYPVSNMDEEEDNTYLAWNAAVGTAKDVNLSHAMAVLEYVLLSAPGAPLKQALLDAQVGQDIEGSYEGGILQPTFSVIAKYANPADKEKFLNVIKDTLEKLAAEGLEKKAIYAAINNMEFKFREADYGSYPRGLMYGIDAFDGWLYDDNAPFEYLKQIQVCDFLKKQAEGSYYEEIIRKYLLDNTHVSLIVMTPEKGLTAKEDQRVKEKLARYKASLSKEQIQELIVNTKKLRVFQETPSTREELEKIPLLHLSDIKKETAPVFNEERSVDGVPLIYHEVDTNGIAYINLMFDATGIPKEYTGYLGVLKGILGMVDTAVHGYRELSNEIDIHSGGIYPALNVFSDVKNPGSFSTKFELHSRVLYNEIDFAFDIMEEILLTSSLKDEKRMHEILARLKSRLQMRLTSAGHLTAATRAMSAFSAVSSFNDSTGGIAFYKLVESLEEQFDEKKKELTEVLEKLMSAIFSKDGFMVSLTAQREVLEKVEKRIKELKEKLSDEKMPEMTDIVETQNRNEGFGTSAQVQYVALAGNFHKAGYDYTGALRVLKVIMGYEYLWTNIRVQGGAYGCMSGYGRSGETYFVSYRDPNLRRTLEVYEGIVEYLKNFNVDERDMCKYIIGTISEMDTPKNPMAQGSYSMRAYMCNITEKDLQRERDEILSCNPGTIRALTPLMEAVLAERNICVLGNEERIEEAKELFNERKPLIGGSKR